MTSSPLPTAAFDAWAMTYDRQRNPMLALEERYMDRLLPSSSGKRILDAGCGTGRWLARLSSRGNHAAMYGIDGSKGMLEIARAKQIPGMTLAQASLPEIPFERGSIDLALSCFALSYVEDIHACSQAFARVLREGADLFVTDVHPLTAHELQWKRGSGSISLAAQARSIDEIVRTMDASGLYLQGRYEPQFGAEELSFFQEAGKLSEYQRACGRPAIYILHFKLNTKISSGSRLSFTSAQCVLGAGEQVLADLRVEGDRIATVGDTPASGASDVKIDLRGYSIFPGFINPHDHLEFALFPRLGVPPYTDAASWAHDIQSRFQETIALHKRVPNEVRLWWGGLRNLLCGVTTVCHHNPYDSAFDDALFPVNVVSQFGWAHSLSFGTDVAAAYAEANRTLPFILHACEGVSEEARQEFSRLQQLGVITDGTVLVHGLSLRPNEIDALNAAGCAVVRCPSSNQFLFDTAPTVEMDRHIVALAIGSDSPLTAPGDLLDEIRFCHNELGYKPDELFDRVFEGASCVLRLREGEGRIAPSARADLVAVRDTGLSPAQRLSALSWKDIELVVVAGIIRLVSPELRQRLSSELTEGFECIYVDGVERWVRVPVHQLLEATTPILGDAGVFLNGRLIALSANERRGRAQEVPDVQ